MAFHLKLHRRARLMVALGLSAVMLCPTGSAAQVATNITSSGLGTTITPPGTSYDITGGTRPGGGANLFHSFGQFSVGAGDIANFLNETQTPTSNILGRVNGGNASSIFGTIRTTDFGTANLFLINPSGWIFGPSASLDVRGSFYASTADYVKLSDGAKFFADPAQNSGLTTASPVAFGFLGPPAAISVEGALLQVDPGQTLSLVGGDDLQIKGGAALIAQGGLVQIGSVASAGEAGLFDSDGTPDLDLGSFASLGKVTISEGAAVIAGSDGILAGGKVVIRSGQLIVDNAFITTDTIELAGTPVGIDLGATDSIVIENGAVVQTASFGAGDASGISIAAESLTVRDFAAVESVAFGAGRTGSIDIQVGSADIINGTIRTSSFASGSDITIAAADTVTIAGPNGVIATESLAFFPDPLTGELPFAGNIALTAGNVVLSDQAKIRSGGAGTEPGESMRIAATGSVTISGLAGIESQAFANNAGTVEIVAQSLAMDAGYINTSTLGAGNAGPILVNANTVSLTNGAQIASSSQIVATGAGGSITVNAPGAVTISGTDPNIGVGNITFTLDPSSGIFSTASGTGNAGEITVATPTLTMADGGKMSVATTGDGNAGSVAVNANSLSFTGGAQVVSSTTGAGEGGSVTANAASSIFISGTGSPVSGLFSTAESTGNAGQIIVTTPTLTMNDGATISVATSGAGNAGNVSLNVTNFTHTGGAIVDSSTSGDGQGGDLSVVAVNSATISGAGTGLFSTASGTGAGGNITVQAPQLQLLGGATISANSTGSDTATAGNVTIAAGQQVSLQNSSITTGATLADGGNISITTTGSLVNLSNSQITTSVESGVGGGGNIAIGSQLIALNNSEVRADAAGGPGGNINIVSTVFLASNSPVTASSQLSTSGVIDIQATVTDVSGDLAQLPETTLQATQLLRAACAARFAGGKTSSMVLGGRDGVPLHPGALMPSPLYMANQAGAPATITGYDLPRFSFLGPAEGGLQLSQYSLLANARCS